ncbi:MAG: hypothetical protein R2797_00050 [Gelidibacter sp.]
MSANQDIAFKELVDKIKEQVSFIETRDGLRPTFEEYIEELIDNGEISVLNLKNDLRAIALGWSGAQLGTTNWKKVYDKLIVETEMANINNNKIESTMNDLYQLVDKEESNLKISAHKKQNKFLSFIQHLFKELDNDVIRLFKTIGLFNIIIGTITMAVLWWIASYFEKESGFYSIMILIVIALTTIYFLQKENESKVKLTATMVISIVGIFISIAIVIALVWGIIDFLKDAFIWLAELVG